MPKLDFHAFAAHAEESWGLTRSSFDSVYGVINGQPVHLFEGADNSGNGFLGVAVAAPSVTAAGETKREWVEVIPFLKKSMVDADETSILARIPTGTAGRLDSEELSERVEQMASIAAMLAPVSANSSRARPALVNGVPMYLTESEAGELSLHGQAAQSEYDQLRTRWIPALLLGLLATVVSGLAWAAIGIMTDREFWLVAIGAGLLISYATVWGARKTNLGLQLTVGLFTVASVFLGQLLTVWWVLNDEFVRISNQQVLDVYVMVLSEDTGTLLFALGGGLIGAWYGARMASKPQIAPEVELAPV